MYYIPPCQARSHFAQKICFIIRIDVSRVLAAGGEHKEQLAHELIQLYAPDEAQVVVVVAGGEGCFEGGVAGRGGVVVARRGTICSQSACHTIRTLLTRT